MSAGNNATNGRPVVRVVAVTQSDPFFTGRFFDTFLTELPHQPVDLVEIVLLPNFNESRIALARRLFRLYGFAGFARLLGRYAAATLADRLGQPRSVETLAARHGVPVRRLATINDDAYLKTLRERRIDLLLSVAAPQIFRKAALDAAPYVLNVHNGKLPAYRGMMPTFWALLHDEREVVITVHEMAARIDAGGVVAEFPVPVGPEDSAFEVSVKAKAVAGREVARLIAGVGSDTWPTARSVDMTGQQYFKFPTYRDVQRLRARGRAML
jgi:methionyl-tRNA formyltransferase